jgi:hypothetical protein
MRQPAGLAYRPACIRPFKQFRPSFPSVGPIKLMSATSFAKIAPDASVPRAGR